MAKRTRDNNLTSPEDIWQSWPVSWSGVLVGMLTALAVLVIVGLIAVAVGAHVVGPSSRIVSWQAFGWGAIIFSVIGAFFSFVAAGWVAARIAGTARAETGMLHGAISWLAAIPLLLILTALGAGSVMGSWYGGLGGTPSWVQAPAPKAAAAPDTEEGRREAEENARATRNGALAALTALVLGLMGSVIGGWWATGDSMSLRYHFGGTAADNRSRAQTAAHT